MFDFIPEQKQFSIVLVGAFNPLMFQPEWFRHNEIILPEEAEYAKNPSLSSPAIITPAITAFSLPQLNVRIEQNRFQVMVEKEPFISCVDFVYNTFDCLGSFSITNYGLNYSAHYKTENAEMYQNIGDRLAPKQYWKELLGDNVSGLERKGGLLSLQINNLKENNAGAITTVIQPSSRIQQGIYMSCNDHFNLIEENKTAEYAISKIKNEFSERLEYMQKIQMSLLYEVSKNEQ